MILIGRNRRNGRPWENPWDTRAREKAGSIDNFRNNINGKLQFNVIPELTFSVSLEQRIVVSDSTHNELAENVKRHYIFEVADAMLSYALNTLSAPMKLAASLIPYKARVPLTIGLGAFAFACSSGGGAVPPATETSSKSDRTLESRINATQVSPTKTPEIKIDYEKLSTPPAIPPISVERTYRFVFPFVQPSDTLEKFVYGKFAKDDDGIATYMKFVRWKQGVAWAKSLSDLINQPSNTSWVDFIRANQYIGKLSAYVPLEDMRAYLESRPINQTFVPAQAEYFQSTETRTLIPLQNPDIDKSFFEKIMKEFLDQKEESEKAVAYEIPKIGKGSKVAFDIQISRDIGGNRDIYLMNITTQEVFKLTDTESSHDYHPAVSPDGSKMVFVSNMDRNYDMWLMDIATRRIARLTDTSVPEDKPSWSKDGRKIIYKTGNDGRIHSMDLYQDECSIAIVDSSLTSLYNSHSLSPDGRQIIYEEYMGDTRGFAIMMANSDGSNKSIIKATELIEAPETYRVFKNPDWSINGDIVAIMSEAYHRDFIMNNRVVIIENGDWSNPKRISSDYKTSLDELRLGYHSPAWSNDGEFVYHQQDVSLNRQPKLLVTDPKTGKTMDARTFKWTTIEAPLTQVSLGELLGIEGKQPYNKECPTTLEKTITYARNVKTADLKELYQLVLEVPYSYDGDREIKVRLNYDSEFAVEYTNNQNKQLGFPPVNNRSSVYVALQNTLRNHILPYSLNISSNKLKSNPAAVITELENRLLNALKKFGVSSIDVLYFKEGNQRYTN